MTRWCFGRYYKCPSCGKMLSDAEATWKSTRSRKEWLQCPCCNAVEILDELCPQFGVIGAACSYPEDFCDQYIFCKKARELQLPESPNIDKVGNCDELLGNSEELSKWAREQIQRNLAGSERLQKSAIFPEATNRMIGYCSALEWVLSLRREK